MPFDARYNRVKLYDHRYEPRGQVGDPCTYCGAESDTMDHIPPLRMVEFLVEAEVDMPRDLITVPACRECNTALNSKPILGIKERRAHVKGYLRRKYAKILRMPRWDEDELSEVSEVMAHNIRAASNLSDFIKARLAWRR